MAIRFSLLAGAGLSALALTASASPASATPTERAEIRALQAQIEALTARLDAQDAARREMQTQVADASSQAEKAGKEVAARSRLVKWAEDTSISGRMYFDFTTVRQRSDGAGVAATDHTTNFDLKRFYLGVDHTFNKVFSANVTTDVTYISGVGASLYLKKAYLQAKVSDALTLRLGAADLPWIPFVEGVYGYRHIENTMTDRIKYGTSSDWGIHALGKLAGGIVEYDLAVVNGGGYRTVPGVGGTNRSRSLDFEGRVNVNYANFIVGVGGYTGKLGKDTTTTPATHTASRLDALIAYKTKRFTVGGEYFRARNYLAVNALPTAPGQKAQGYSAFASVTLTPKVSVFGRYDHVKPNKTLVDFKDDYFNVGVQYSPARIVDLALVLKRERVANGLLSTSNGTIGGPTPGTNGTYTEFGLFGQFRF